MGRPNIVCLILDSARADLLSCYGGTVSTPNLDRFASEGIRFKNAFAPAPWTVPSHASLFTGAYPSEHQTDKGNRRLNPRYETLAEKLSSVGYQTILYSNNVHLTDEFDFTRGFDIADGSYAVSQDDGTINWNEFISEREHEVGIRKYAEILSHLYEQRDKDLLRSFRQAFELKYNYHFGDNGARETNRFLEKRHAAFESPYFIVVNYMEPHNPFRPPDVEAEPPEINGWEYAAGMESLTNADLETLCELYAGELQYIDERVGKVVSRLNDGNTLFVITSDHGVELGEHGLLYHGDCLYNTVSRVPLILYGLEERDPVPYTTSLIGLHRTFCELAGYEVEDHVRGSNVLSIDDHESAYMEIQGQSEEILEQIRAAQGEKIAEENDPHYRAVAHGHYKYIEDVTTGKTELYDYWNDPLEQSPVSNADAEAAMRDRLAAIVSSLEPRQHDGDVGSLSDDTMDQLKHLGYKI